RLRPVEERIAVGRRRAVVVARVLAGGGRRRGVRGRRALCARRRAGRDGGGAQMLDGREQIGAALLAQHLADEAAEQAHVVPQAFDGLGSWLRHAGSVGCRSPWRNHQPTSKMQRYCSAMLTELIVAGFTGVDPSPPGRVGAVAIAFTTSMPLVTRPK